MNSLYNLAGRQSAAIRSDLDAYAGNVSLGPSLRPQITSSISALVKTIEDYEAMAKRELVVAKREKALARVAALHQDVVQFRSQLASIDMQGRSASAIPASASVASTSSRARPVDQASGAGPSAYMSSRTPHGTVMSAAPMQQTLYSMPPPMPNTYAYAQPASDPLASYRAHQQGAYPTEERPYSMRESHALREHSFIQNTEAQLDAFIAQGRAVLGNLSEQRGILKGTRKRLLDAANSVGLSRELIVCKKR